MERARLRSWIIGRPGCLIAAEFAMFRLRKAWRHPCCSANAMASRRASPALLTSSHALGGRVTLAPAADCNRTVPAGVAGLAKLDLANRISEIIDCVSGLPTKQAVPILQRLG